MNKRSKPLVGEEDLKDDSQPHMGTEDNSILATEWDLALSSTSPVVSNSHSRQNTADGGWCKSIHAKEKLSLELAFGTYNSFRSPASSSSVLSMNNNHEQITSLFPKKQQLPFIIWQIQFTHHPFLQKASNPMTEE